ncbi:MAG TPA: VWA domain-containing protein [Pirellulales bacterium]|jgi:uncharacterized membrane protein|nr:VWA domain-containing protein [Pirellulales bacterium]
MSGWSSSLELSRPIWLIGSLTLPLLGWYFYRSLVDFSRVQRLVSLALRAAIIVLLVAALAGLTLLRPTHEQFVVFALDRSLSIGEDSRQAAEHFVDEALTTQAGHAAAFIAFAEEPAPIAADRHAPEARLNPSGTNIARVLEAAAAALPPAYVPQIVLLSDGNPTAGDAVRAALQCGVPVTTVPLATRSEPEVQVSSVQVPAQVREGEPFAVDVVIDANHDDEARVEVFRGAHQVLAERRKLKKGENRFRFEQSIVRERLAEYTVRVSGAAHDTLLDNNTASGLVFTSGKPRVLLVDSEPKQSQSLAQALEQEEIQVDVRPEAGLPDALGDLQNYELLILSNVPATALSQRQMEMVRTFVQDLGGGLIMIGGDQSFGLGGYYKTVLEEVLPVRSDFEKDKEKPSLAMVLVIDKSGSMGGEKIELAKEAAGAAVELLGPSDRIGVIAFEGESFWLSELQAAGNKSRILDEISRLEAGGGTNMYPAMEDAYDALQSANAKLKHAIILTDGISSPGDFQGLATSMASSRITVSTVAVGDGADTNLLEEIASLGHGRYYFTDDPNSVPQIFAKETVEASKSAIQEQPFLPQVMRLTPVLGGIDLKSAPFLLGYVMTRPKPTSELILISEQGDPVLAWWRYGLGMSVAFTSDAKSRWAPEWLTWPGYSKFWAQVVRHAMRKAEAHGVFVDIQQRMGRAVVTMDAANPDGQYINQAQTQLTVIDPQLGQRQLELAQVAPGRYTADFPTPRSGAYHLELSQQQGGKTISRLARGLTIGYPDELRLRPTNDELLRSLARVSGGRYNPTPSEIFAATERTAARPTPLWPYLVLAAALLWVLDVALRRIDFSLFLPLRTLAAGRRPAG